MRIEESRSEDEDVMLSSILNPNTSILPHQPAENLRPTIEHKKMAFAGVQVERCAGQQVS